MAAGVAATVMLARNVAMAEVAMEVLRMAVATEVTTPMKMAEDGRSGGRKTGRWRRRCHGERGCGEGAARAVAARAVAARTAARAEATSERRKRGSSLSVWARPAGTRRWGSERDGKSGRFIIRVFIIR